jgi:hypothetical protein
MSQEDVEIVRRLLGPFEHVDMAPLYRYDAIAATFTAATADAITADFKCVFIRGRRGSLHVSRRRGS